LAKFDVHRLRRGTGLVVDCQSNLNASLATRVVVPLVRRRLLPVPLSPRLNPVVTIGGEAFVVAVQALQTIATRDLAERVTSLIEHDRIIADALDALFFGI